MSPYLKQIDNEKWNALLPFCNRSNLMQNWQYGEAKKTALLWRPKRFVILDENGKPFGILQVLTVSLPLIGGIARINRGPLLFVNIWEHELPIETIEKALQAICRGAKENRWKYMLIAPELPSDQRLETLMKSCGFIQKKGSAWGSSIVSLDRDEETIRTSLHGKWRNLLKKSNEFKLEFEYGNSKEKVDFLLNEYRLSKKEKHFSGIPEKLIRKMSAQRGDSWDFYVLYARYQEKRVGGVLIVGHGDTCTYFVGWTPDEGRKFQATYFLLWQAILLFKSLGYRWLDVGGLNEQTLKGIAHFKNGLKGEMYKLVGEWVKY